nr:MAG TPA: hypothetical protein [Caudoviricetes sp.]DAY31385.1 MAG TPA: hypothetical protein [Caudoviricetes sp.]
MFITDILEIVYYNGNRYVIDYVFICLSNI